MHRLIFLVLLVSAANLFSQQEKLTSQYLFNKLALNPAYAGASRNLSVVSIYRNQWGGIVGQPIQYMNSVSIPLQGTPHNFGVNLNLDKIGPISHFNFYGNYSFRMSLTETSSLQLGLRGGVDHGVVNFAALSGHYNGDPEYANPGASYIKPVIGTGVYYESEKLSLGLSIPNFFVGSLDFIADEEIFRNTTQAYFGGEYLFKLNDQFSIKPSTYINYNAKSPTVVDFNSYIIYRSMFWLGVGYRTSNTIMLNGILTLNSNVIPSLKHEIKVGYSYDFARSLYNRVTNGTHEFMISINLASKKSWMNQTEAVNPRYF